MLSWTFLILPPWMLVAFFANRWWQERASREKLLEDLVWVATEGRATSQLRALDAAYNRLVVKHPHRRSFRGDEINAELELMREERHP